MCVCVFTACTGMYVHICDYFVCVPSSLPSTVTSAWPVNNNNNDNNNDKSCFSLERRDGRALVGVVCTTHTLRVHTLLLSVFVWNQWLLHKDAWSIDASGLAVDARSPFKARVSH